MVATEGVVARTADFTADIDADGAVADGADLELGFSEHELNTVQKDYGQEASHSD